MVGDVSNQRGWSRERGGRRPRQDRDAFVCRGQRQILDCHAGGWRYMFIGSGPHVGGGGGLEYPHGKGKYGGPPPEIFLKYR